MQSDSIISTACKTAIVYDFDGTLAPGNIQEHSFLPDHEMDKGIFWNRVKTLTEQHDCDQILVYMREMLRLSKDKGVPITRERLRSYGADLELYPGVESWFARLNEYAANRQLELEHYVISSGNEEIIRGCQISDRFKQIFASRFIYNENGTAEWPGLAINYTTKTQYLFRINKGVDNSWDNEAVNRWIPLDERRVPFERMIFIGDGDTDIPAMKMVRQQGGHAIAVFSSDIWNNERTQEKLHHLIAEDRANYVAPADYSQGGQLDVIVKGILARYARNSI
jgi:phosphoserine phosphatase